MIVRKYCPEMYPEPAGEAVMPMAGKAEVPAVSTGWTDREA